MLPGSVNDSCIYKKTLGDGAMVLLLKCKDNSWKENIVQPMAGLTYHNDDGVLRADVDNDETYMHSIYPLYTGPTKTIAIGSAYMLSVDAEPYNERRRQTLDLITKARAIVPPIQVFMGYSEKTVISVPSIGIWTETLVGRN